MVKDLTKESIRSLNLSLNFLSREIFKATDNLFRSNLSIYLDYPEVHFKFGYFLNQLQEHGEGVKEFRDELNCKPQDPRFHISLGKIHLNLKKFDVVVCVSHQGVCVFPFNIRCRFGEVLFKAVKYKESEKEYREVIKRNQKYFGAYIGLAELLNCWKRYRKIPLVYQKLLAIGSKCELTNIEFGIFSCELAYYERVENEFKQTIRIKPPDEKSHYRLGTPFLNTNRVSFREGSKTITKARKKVIELNSTFVDPYLAFACSYSFMSENERKIKFVENTIKIEPNNARACCGLGNIYLEKGVYCDAKKNIWKVLMINPNFYNTAEKQKATIYLRELQEEVLMSATHFGISELKEEGLRKIINLGPDNVETYYLFSEVIIFLGSSDSRELGKKLENTKRGAILNPDCFEAYFALGSLCFKKGRYKCIEEESGKVVSIEPNYMDKNLVSATLFLRFYLSHKKLVELAITDVGLYLAYVYVSLNLSKFNEILEVFKKVLKFSK